MRLATRRWPEVPDDALVLLPLGSLEQHGRHLPLDVDTVIAEAVATGAAERLPEPVLVAPAVAYGASGEHEGFRGTVSAGTVALELSLVELGRSLSGWAPRLVIVNAHGGNLDALVAATRRLRAEGRDVSWLPCEHGDLHAGHGETSLLLHLDPERVRMAEATPGPDTPLERLLPHLRTHGVAAVAPDGVLGDPRTATADEGARLLEQMITAAVRRVIDDAPDSDGLLRVASA